jgi:hypothetical protein
MLLGLWAPAYRAPAGYQKLASHVEICMPSLVRRPENFSLAGLELRSPDLSIPCRVVCQGWLPLEEEVWRVFQGWLTLKVEILGEVQQEVMTIGLSRMLQLSLKSILAARCL